MHLVSNKASQNVLMATYFAMTDQRLNVYHSCGKTNVSEKYEVWGFFEKHVCECFWFLYSSLRNKILYMFYVKK